MAPSFSSYLTRLISALAKVDAMLPRIKPKKSFPNTMTKLARTVQRGKKNQSLIYGAFSQDVRTAILVFQKNNVDESNQPCRSCKGVARWQSGEYPLYDPVWPPPPPSPWTKPGYALELHSFLMWTFPLVIQSNLDFSNTQFFEPPDNSIQKPLPSRQSNTEISNSSADFLNQFSFLLEARKIGIPLY